MSSSLTGPAVMPSGGSFESMRYSLKRRFEAEDAMLCVDRKRGCTGGGEGGSLVCAGWVWVAEGWSLGREVGVSVPKRVVKRAVLPTMGFEQECSVFGG